MSSAYIENVVKEALIRRRGRQGRLAKSDDARRRELDAAGRARQDHPEAFSYPRGKLTKASEEDDAKAKLERAKKVDLIDLPANVAGTNCGNCKFFEDNYCHEPSVDQEVTNRKCCQLWDAPGTGRPWEKSAGILFNV